MIIGHRDSNELIYHYTKMSWAKRDILPKRRLMLGRYTNTDDPKESKEWRFVPCARERQTLLKPAVLSLSKKIGDALKSKTRVVCFCRDHDVLTGNHLQDVSRRGFAKPRMWAHRGGSSASVCLVFDRKQLRERLESHLPSARILHGSVAYLDKDIVKSKGEPAFSINVNQLESIGFNRYVEMHLRQFNSQLFFEKATDWQHETEFRFVVFSETEDDLFVEYGNSLRGVIFGENATVEDIDDILRMLPLTTQVMALKSENGCLWYDFGNLKYNDVFRRNEGLYFDQKID